METLVAVRMAPINTASRQPNPANRASDAPSAKGKTTPPHAAQNAAPTAFLIISMSVSSPARNIRTTTPSCAKTLKTAASDSGRCPTTAAGEENQEKRQTLTRVGPRITPASSSPNTTGRPTRAPRPPVALASRISTAMKRSTWSEMSTAYPKARRHPRRATQSSSAKIMTGINASSK